MTRDLELGRRRPAGCLSDRALDGLAAGELAGEPGSTAAAHLAGCAACAARARDIEATRRAFPLEAPSFDALIAVRSARRRWLWPSLGAGLATAAAALVLVVAPHGPRPTDAGVRRDKGADRLSLFVLHAGARRAAAPGEIVHPGDRLQLAYTAAHNEHLAVLASTAAGHATVLFPRGDAAARIDAATLAPLPYSLELDAELGLVRVYGLFCPRDEPLGAVRAALESGGAPAWPAGCHVDRLTYDVRP